MTKMKKNIALSALCVPLALASMPASAIDGTAAKSAASQTEVLAARGDGGQRSSGLFGCSASGSKNEIGAAVGGVLGGFLGNRIAGKRSRTLGTVLGAGVGVFAGQALGCKLQKNDQVKAERALEEAVATNQSQNWESAETGASGKVDVLSSQTGSGLANLKFAKGVEPASGYASIGKAFTTRGAANIRSKPGLDGAVLGQLPAGTRVWVPASVSGTPWYLISENGVGQGYVSNALVKPAVTQTAANGCKMVKQTVNLPDQGSASETYQACKDSSGEWVMTRV
jgi:outer membrane lipoprotein SlyB